MYLLKADNYKFWQISTQLNSPILQKFISTKISFLKINYGTSLYFRIKYEKGNNILYSSQNREKITEEIYVRIIV